MTRAAIARERGYNVCGDLCGYVRSKEWVIRAVPLERQGVGRRCGGVLSRRPSDASMARLVEP